ncbi:pickpocket protein 28-like, partial [Sitodiplosis mosellana]|uniref:pickpocket protein 28-like n=1 Tax=Sitodiplosis mosellana TaxID=263140 RepID=UPI002444EB61
AWWIIAFVLSLSFCFNSIFAVWLKWRDSPIIITFDNKPTLIGDIPFTAVTICPLTKTSSKKFNYTDVYRSMFKLDGNDSRKVSENELKVVQIVSQLCNDRIARDVFDLFNENYTDSSIQSIISELAPKFDDTFVRCKQFDRWTACDQLLFPIITEEGLCYVFNGFNINDIVTNELTSEFFGMRNDQPPSNWDLESGYDESIKNDKYPHRIYGTGNQASIIIVLRVDNNDIDHLCSGEVQGFKVIFHPPHDGPQVLKRYFQVSPGKTAQFSIDPRFTYSTPNVKKYRPDVTQCYFSSERKLQFYKKYSQHNCEVECLANFTLTKCGCVKFTMPRTKETKVCGSAKIDCASNAGNNIYRDGAFYKCKCLPSCVSLSYDADISIADYDLVSHYSKAQFQPDHVFNRIDFENSTFSRLVISFREESFIPSKRDEYYTLSDFLANSGGLISLCLGASTLSFIELLYYFTIRIIFSKRSQQKTKQQPISTILPTYNSYNQVTGRNTTIKPIKQMMYLP